MEDLKSIDSLLLCGVGKMGSALLNGWLSKGVEPSKINVFEPNPSDWLKALVKKGLNLNIKPSKNPKVCVIAVKPQLINEVLKQNNFNGFKGTLFVSIVAGVQLERLSELLDLNASIVRVMPNTPATIGKGVSCLIANPLVNQKQMQLVETLFSAVGETIRLPSEKQMDAVTAISGSGPGYVFYLIEVLAQAGITLGLDNKLARKLALLTVSGAGLLAEKSDLSASQLRGNVTSPKGTTEAALQILMDSETGLLPLIEKAVLAAHSRSKELGS